MAHQPYREPWALEQLNYEHSILLGMSTDHSTSATYTSALNLYLTFWKTHGILIEPTPQTLSYYTTFQTFHINPKSVALYLLGICNELEPYFPKVSNNHKSPPINHTQAGARCYHGTPTIQKSPLTDANLGAVSHKLATSPLLSHNHLLKWYHLLKIISYGLKCAPILFIYLTTIVEEVYIYVLRT
jgi:hypothetical protein